MIAFFIGRSTREQIPSSFSTTLVRPAMEYATTAWAPHTAQNCNKLEQVQRRAARFACHRYERTASVTAMLNNLKWETLETRRNNQTLTMFYRMQHNMVVSLNHDGTDGPSIQSSCLPVIRHVSASAAGPSVHTAAVISDLITYLPHPNPFCSRVPLRSSVVSVVNCSSYRR